MDTIGFVGLGAMGSHMAARFLAAGHKVYGTNRTAAKAALHVPLPGAAVANEIVSVGRRLGYGEQDLAALFEVLAKIARRGQDVRPGPRGASNGPARCFSGTSRPG